MRYRSIGDGMMAPALKMVTASTLSPQCGTLSEKSKSGAADGEHRVPPQALERAPRTSRPGNASVRSSWSIVCTPSTNVAT